MKLKELRKRKNFTQKELSIMLDLPLNTYTHYELENREAPISFYIKVFKFQKDLLLSIPSQNNLFKLYSYKKVKHAFFLFC